MCTKINNPSPAESIRQKRNLRQLCGVFMLSAVISSTVPAYADSRTQREAMRYFGYTVAGDDFISFYYFRPREKPIDGSAYSQDLGEEKIKQLLREIKKLKPETTADSVKDRLGNPTFDQINYTKSGNPVFISRTLTYHVRKVEVGFVNVRDQYVKLDFNRDNKLKTISIFNIKDTLRD